MRRIVILTLVFILFAGCTTLTTQKGRMERDFCLEEKELYLKNARINIGYYNCIQSGFSSEFCSRQFEVEEAIRPRELGRSESYRREREIQKERADPGQAKKIVHKNYLNIGADPQDTKRRLAADESIAILKEDLQVKLRGRSKNYIGWLRAGDPAHAVVVDSAGRPKWVKKCGNDILEIIDDANFSLTQNAVVKEIETRKVEEIKAPDFRPMPRPTNMGHAYLDAPKGSWQGNLWDLIHFNFGAGLIYHMGLPDTNTNISVGAGANATGGTGGSAVSNAQGGNSQGGSGGSSSSSAQGGTGESSSSGGSPAGGSPSGGSSSGGPAGGASVGGPSGGAP